ncbi:MAG: hypothetical protein HUJ70_13335 [Pseudobutyrivibrio sp.]|nr:hypothetical protein [Pseudobutyrivibrio sp.]
MKTIKMIAEASQKLYITAEEGRLLYSMGIHTFHDIAREANAVRKVTSTKYIYSTKAINEYIETMFG